eukprot:Pgem_evm1s10627
MIFNNAFICYALLCLLVITNVSSAPTSSHLIKHKTTVIRKARGCGRWVCGNSNGGVTEPEEVEEIDTEQYAQILFEHIKNNQLRQLLKAYKEEKKRGINHDEYNGWDDDEDTLESEAIEFDLSMFLAHRSELMEKLKELIEVRGDHYKEVIENSDIENDIVTKVSALIDAWCE